MFGTEGTETRQDVEALALAASEEANGVERAPEVNPDVVVDIADYRSAPVEIDRSVSPISADIVDFSAAAQETDITGSAVTITANICGGILEALRDVAA